MQLCKSFYGTSLSEAVSYVICLIYMNFLIFRAKWKKVVHDFVSETSPVVGNLNLIANIRMSFTKFNKFWNSDFTILYQPFFNEMSKSTYSFNAPMLYLGRLFIRFKIFIY